MSNMIQNGLAWLETQRVAHAAEAVVYSRGAAELTVHGTAGRTKGELTTHEGLTLEADLADWIIAAAELAGLVDPAGEPAEGDEIVQTVGETSVTWQVACPDEGLPAFEWEPGRLCYRIHCQEIVASPERAPAPGAG